MKFVCDRWILLLVCFVGAFGLTGCKPQTPPPQARQIDFRKPLPEGMVALRKIDPSEYPDFGAQAADPARLETAIDNLSLLYEAGYKESFLNNTLYVAGTLYQQDKTEPQINGIPFQVKAQGLELEAVYQPTKALSLNANFTYQSVTDFGSGFFQQTYSYLDGYPVGFMVDGQSGTGNGSPNYSAVPQNNYAYTYVPPNGRMRAPGEPAVLANAFVQYQWKNGF